MVRTVPWRGLLTAKERRTLRPLRRPSAIQDFLESFPINHETDGETCKSPRRVLATRTAHCIEGAFLAATILWFHGRRPLLLDLKTGRGDFDHVVALFTVDGRWGALSKTNHAVLRYREPVYRDPRELAMSYFHEYYVDDGRKSLRSYSAIFDLSRLGWDWIVREDNLWDVSYALDRSRHYPILPRPHRRLRRLDPIELRAGEIAQWEEDAPPRR